ncbi:hypothetical protein OGAPHI_000378 [Ogataea philodendri]|uniref:Scaffold protein Nfu/NifU N-terminal domain-containing protein n=1 Tax=Ogataea philodendri TaxID=1378263 RepID=A0A9P8T9T2_9ASCO|nr:uncharacterized protein OGAPHI_000378 [Ogataea philodendri]KAH3671673.1 hypothetical protein OGAPHI_000378 [Ogataea philodendri]
MIMFASRSIRPRQFLPTQLRRLFIQTQLTPNENALKFVPSEFKFLPSSTTPTLEVSNVKDALNKSELAFKLFSANDKSIESILFGYNFITVVKGEQHNWSLLKPEIFSILTEHLNSGQAVINQDYMEILRQQTEEADEADEYEDEDEVIALITELLTTRIQPAIQEDGGDIKFVKFDEDTGTVHLKLIGACKSCSSSEITLKNGIEEMLKFYIDEVKHVQQIADEEDQPESIINDYRPIKKEQSSSL